LLMATGGEAREAGDPADRAGTTGAAGVGA
jgi:hypothetical protein